MASNQTTTTTTTTTNSAYNFYQETLKSPQYILAPMVDQSELPFRMLCRKYGAQLCYTPMLHSGMFLKDKNYRVKSFTTHTSDRPLIAQFCANDPHTLLEAARLVEDRCDAVDINLGCPQSIAKRGNYGAFLQDNWELVGQLIATLRDHLSIPVTCKIRVFSDIKRTIDYARFLEAKGCSILTVHGRTRDQRGVLIGKASWEHILAVKRAVSIPVFANGNILNNDDVTACLNATTADGVMSAEGLLYNPALFTGLSVGVFEIAREYLDMVNMYPVHKSAVRGHLFKLFHDLLQDPNFDEFRQQIGTASDLKKLIEIVERIGFRIEKNGETEKWNCRPYLHHIIKEDISNEVNKNNSPVITNEAEIPSSNLKKSRAELYEMCLECGFNPKCAKCEHNRCRKCCKGTCKLLKLACEGHSFKLR